MFTITAPAKINLALDIKYRRPDGYHEVDMIMQSIMLSDEIELADADRDSLICNHPLLPVDDGNIALRAANLLREYTGVKKGLAIRIKKKIPVAAGMAGGSTDAAAVLIGLNQFWDLGLTRDVLLRMGLQLGADVPFCILKGTYRARGIGEEMTRVASKFHRPVFIITPDFQLATAGVYKGFQEKTHNARPNIDKVVEALEKDDLSELTAYWGNALENAARNQCPPLEQLYSQLQKLKLSNFLMSGSGPTVFLIDPPQEKVNQLQEQIPPNWFTCLTEMWNSNGIP